MVLSTAFLDVEVTYEGCLYLGVGILQSITYVGLCRKMDDAIELCFGGQRSHVGVIVEIHFHKTGPDAPASV